ncbi:hypothetical protein [Sphingobacterium sp. HSC-15S19]|uniref:hypothetical protein n=1 Tax=Sphingobacterium sp. HSC-15S19 TaxID=2910971 RepID=UPI003D1D3578
MKILIILMSFLFAHTPQENTCKLDITDLVVNAMKIGEKEFDKDFTGQLYQKKSWKVYHTFIDHEIYHDILSWSIPGFSMANDSCEFALTQTNGIGLVENRLVYAKNDFNQVELQRPFYNFEKNAFSTIIWVRDQSWMGGFCVLVYFNIDNGVCRFIKGEPFIVSDVQY